jgi:hypothetical protein
LSVLLDHTAAELADSRLLTLGLLGWQVWGISGAAGADEDP